MPVTARVPAKVNLQLSVGPLRGDGYHDLVTVFHAVSLFDEVTVQPANRSSVRVTGEGAASVPSGRANLAARAARALATAALPRQSRPAVHIEIRKRIPVSAGLAGGSADAAATLVACNELWRTGLTQTELRDVAATVGSDVPFALLGGTAIGQGRGELLTAALTAGTYHWVLAFSAGALSTPEVYATCDRLRAARAARAGNAAARADGAGRRGLAAGQQAGAGRRGPADGQQAGAGRPGPADGQQAGAGRPVLSTELMAALRSGDPAAVGPLLSNDLQPAAVSLRPELRRTLAAGRELGALGAIVSGSGPTCAFLAADADRARELAVSLTGAGVCRGVVRVQGPAAGAAVTAPVAG
jgi:4-diphosphocytidyl-2-C-methyl-D-erythritol kinase